MAQQVLDGPAGLGHMISVAQRVLERAGRRAVRADEQGRPLTFGKVALTAVVGNEYGAHEITADVLQALHDVGCTVPA